MFHNFESLHLPSEDILSHAERVRTLAEVTRKVTTGVHDKEFGCERCPSCTIGLIEEIETPLHIDLLQDSGSLEKTLHCATSFPRTFQAFLISSAKTAHKKRETAQNLLNILTTICEQAVTAYKGGRYLEYARIIATLERNRSTISLALQHEKGLKKLLKQIRRVEKMGQEKLETLLQSLGRLECHGEPPKFIHEKNMRCGGGGIVLLPGESECPRMFITKFSLERVVVIGHMSELTESSYVGVMVPRVRELSFDVVLEPERQGEGAINKGVDDDALKQHGRIEHTFTIKGILPRYYYAALCAYSTSMHHSDFGKRFEDRHDLKRESMLDKILFNPNVKDKEKILREGGASKMPDDKGKK